MSMTGWGNRLTVPVTPERDQIRGPADAPVTVVEYGDYQCPHCAAVHPVIEGLRRELVDEVRFVYRHFPLTTVHPDAWGAAEAAEAAGNQDRFWPMHDLLFIDQAHLGVTDLLARAIALGLDRDRFEEDLRDRVHARKVQEDFLSGVHSGVQGTPTFYVNDVRYDGQPDEEGLFSAIEQALADPAP